MESNFDYRLENEKREWKFSLNLIPDISQSKATGMLQNGKLIWSDGDEWETLAFTRV